MGGVGTQWPRPRGWLKTRLETRACRLPPAAPCWLGWAPPSNLADRTRAPPSRTMAASLSWPTSPRRGGGQEGQSFRRLGAWRPLGAARPEGRMRRARTHACREHNTLFYYPLT